MTRGVSRSSMRTSHRPLSRRAYNHDPTAATRLPRCSGPVGEGAKRPVSVITRMVVGYKICRMGQHEENKAVVRKYVDAFNRGDLDALRALFADDAEIQGVLG